MASTAAPFPLKDAIAGPSGLIGSRWIQWFTDLLSDVDAAPARIKTVTLTGKSASLGVSSIPTGTLSAGLYRVDWYARVTIAGTVSSSLTVTLGWTESTIPLTTSGAAMTGNTTTTTQTGTVLLLLDQASPLTYSTTYASVGATAMVYRLTIVATQIDA